MSDRAGTGRLTTHVLDTARGRPAENLRIDLLRVDGDRLHEIRSVQTNADGRTDEPMLVGADFVAGIYELRFHAGAYHNLRSEGPPFLDVVPVRFGIADASGHYHVPLLLSPYGYSTYRGS